MELDLIIVTSVLGGVSLLLLVLVLVLFLQLNSLKRKMRQTPSIRVQKLRMDDKNHAFQNPTISPDEELSRRGYSMYVPEDVERADRGTERQTGGQFVEELARELDHRQQRQSTAPPFLLQSVQENKRKSLSNPAARQSETNPNFIY
ncbi:uncharacterized protein LOC125229665 [Leguminivora glycinivorella]|uniref:uncharacterized protein LOC125229665 n=1 Tax=Leguminivora glycinivorella TaxID=1035111 RepID=UPI00200DF944|nr:uncharacterized protein LOC125229665 [Leguminivora glycinivorella]